jgi:Domain of unknown function (DUF4402)
MMTRLYRIFYSLIFFLHVTAVGVTAQVTPPVSTSGHVTAEIIPVFSANEIAQMNFGRFSPGAEGGEIILSPQNTVSVLGSIFKGVGTHNAASFYVTGDIDAAFTITLPSGPVVLTNISNAKTMKIENWVSIPAPTIGAGKLQDGFQTVYVGATLKVGTLYDNPIGLYTGTYTITFDFN